MTLLLVHHNYNQHHRHCYHYQHLDHHPLRMLLTKHNLNTGHVSAHSKAQVAQLLTSALPIAALTLQLPALELL